MRDGGAGAGVGVIDVLLRKGLKNVDCYLLLAKECMVFVREKAKDEILPGAFGYSTIHIREHAHPSGAGLCSVMEDRGNLVIPYDRLKSVRLARALSIGTMRREYALLLRYLDKSQRERRLSAFLTPPSISKDAAPGARLDRTRLSREYAAEVAGLLRGSIPRGEVVVAEA